MDLEPFLTLNMSNKKWKLVYINQYSTFEIIESSYETGMSIIYKTKKTLDQFIILLELDHFLYFWGSTKTPNLSNYKWKLAYLGQ